ncbi:vWA domain-containing protein [Butyrivibrio sp. YAB3001]|uniref:vWA domain-containing protein n=1 Tax=Butyrivibrio sp. YAB3001 TaxID=1520812 RepID=UPI0008F648E8|nr:VWA-like domain-containing protein [Butyrivibrio sp. YAB3001]SFB88091.1 Putative metallopeptidase domain-containing protein [Butyrivibrio sp. YAB3001]
MERNLSGSEKRLELEETGKRILNAARTELYIEMRFMGAALSSLGFEMDLSTTSIGTDAVNIRFNPAHVLRLFVEEPGKLNRTYIHMLLHCIFMHMYTSEKYSDERLYDICADIVVESILDGMDYQCIYRISSDYRDRWYELLEKELKVLTVEKLYRYFSETNVIDIFEMEKLEREFALDDHGFWKRLKDKPVNDDSKDEDKEKPPIDEDYNTPDGAQNEENQRKDGNNNGTANDKNPENNLQDNSGKLPEKEKKKTKYINPHRLQKIENSRQNWEKEGKRIQTEIETVGKKYSDKLGKLAWMLKIHNTSRTDYREFLQKFKVLREEGGIDLDSFDYGMYSFGLEQYGNMPLIEENEFREVKKIQDLVIVIDTSASCKDSLVQRFLDETAGILLDNDNFFQKISICVIQSDDQVQKTDFIRSKEEMHKYSSEIRLEGGFGTDFRPVFDYVDNLILEKKFDNLKGLLYFTDGFGIYPQKPTSYDTAFIFAKNEEYEDENVPDWAMKLYI